MKLKIKDVPFLTAETFEDFTKKYVDGFGSYAVLKGIEKPRNSVEFQELTKRLYGVELDVECFAYPLGAFSNHEYSANYKVIYEGGQDKYSREGIYPLWDKKYSQYDGLKVLLTYCFGRLSCGGVAHVHYGQTEVPTKTDWLRIQKWGNQGKNYLKHISDQHNSLVEIFGHNPFV